MKFINDLAYIMFIIGSSFLFVASTFMQFIVRSKISKMINNMEKIVTLAKLEALMSLVQMLSSDEVSDLIEGSILSFPLKRPVDDIIKYVSDNWDNLKGFAELLQNKIKKADKISLLYEEIKISMSRIDIENKISLILLLLSVIFLFLNLIPISFLLSGLVIGISSIVIITLLVVIKYYKDITDYYMENLKQKHFPH
ncbi:MAG: hypothetical protein QXH75_00645 [Sulfolobaceae archaeon]